MTYIVVIISLLFISALASGAESAFFSLEPKDKERLKNDESRASKMVLKLLQNPKELLATLLITNNFVNVAVVILSSAVLENVELIKADETTRFLIEVVGITFTLLLIGEVIPKIYFTQNAYMMSRMMAIPVNIIRIIPPLSWFKKLLVNGTKLIQRRAGKKGIKITTDELEQALALTKEENTSEEEHKILEGIVKFGNTEVCQIMTPRLEVVSVNESSSYTELNNLILQNGYSRIPVYQGTLDNVIGVLYIKDLLPHLSKDDAYNWVELIRKPFFVPENKKIDDLLKEFQTKKMHMAIVVDEYGGSSGVITLEDILEEIVGDITDEFDDDELIYTKINDNTYLFEGRTALVDFYKVVNIDGKEFERMKGDSDTLSGFIIEQAGRIMKNNEFILFDSIKLVVESSDKRRIKMIKVQLPKIQNEK